MNAECLICKAPLEYLERDEAMECAVCRKREPGKTRCTAGHYVCSECHMKGVDSIVGLCLAETSRDPNIIFGRLIDLPMCHMHGPEHHIMVGAALLTAYKNAGGDIDLPGALGEMCSRGRQVPGGACGFWGACGAGISSGIFVSIATGATPLSEGQRGLANKMTARSLDRIGGIGGPRCCKRDSYIAIAEAARFSAEELGVELERSPVSCRHSARNNQCIGGRCPFFAGP